MGGASWSWTIVHAVDEASPFHGLTADECIRSDVEVLVLLKGIDETFSQVVHARSSYKPHDMVWNARFEDIFNYLPELGPIGVDVSRIHNVERLEPASEGVSP